MRSYGLWHWVDRSFIMCKRCVCMYMCVHVHTHACVCMCAYVYVRTCACMCFHVCAYVCVCMQMRVHVCMCVYTCMCMRVHVYVCACVHVCAYVFARTPLGGFCLQSVSLAPPGVPPGKGGKGGAPSLHPLPTPFSPVDSPSQDVCPGFLLSFAYLPPPESFSVFGGNAGNSGGGQGGFNILIVG